MKTSLEKTDSLARKLKIEVPAEKVSLAFDKVYKELQKNANIKGFRKGKAPLTMIKSLYADRVKQDVLEDLINAGYNHALGEHKLNPVAQPRVSFDKLDEASTFNFTAEFDVRPQVNLKKIDKLTVEKEKLEVNEEKIESILTQIRESRSNLVPVFEDRPAVDGDIVEIDFVGTINGQPLEGGSMTGHKLHIGSKNFIPGFEEGVIGMRVGEKRELNLTFPADYGHAEIAGKPVKFEVTAKAILKKDLPPLDDAFVKSLGGFESLDALKEVIRTDVSQQENQRIQDELKSRLLKVLVKENPVEVPQSLKQQQKEFLISDVEKRMKEKGMADAEFADYKVKWDKDFDETASFMIQTSFLIDELAEKFKLSATAQEYDARLEKYAKDSGIEIAKLREFYAKNHERKHQMKYQITEEKVVDYLLKNSEIKELPREKLSKS